MTYLSSIFVLVGTYDSVQKITGLAETHYLNYLKKCITNKGGALFRQRVMEYKIIAQIVELSATILKIYVADFVPATGNSNETRPSSTAILMALHFRILQQMFEITSLNSQTCLNLKELQCRRTVL
jgi:hypothetical protein